MSQLPSGILSHNASLNSAFAAFYLMVFATAFWLFGLSHWWLYSYGIHFFIFSFGVGFGLHRCIAHQTAGVPRWLYRLAALVGSLANTGSPISWGVSHTLHHIHSDRESDPQSPKFHSLKILFGYVKIRNKEDVIGSFPVLSRVATDGFLTALHRFHYAILILFCILMFLVAGLKGLFFFALIPSGVGFFSLNLISYFGHLDYGYQNHQTQEHSRNIWWLFPLTFGENWHNNHHHAPKARSTRSRPFEVDLVSFYFHILRIGRAE